ncbi:hypothetical protein [uncultured Hyphomicrobium sp.]|uniref:hypothetical protein n=1 Tax=uncultured Hyphomicrobium sp. TaxID=194373 RepID=UPI0025CD6B03|nr:hypothetical protein [uncultured Hyphomicrobium sp.]
MTRQRSALACIAVAGVLIAPQAANADMGKAPATQGIIVSIEGGYLHQSGPDIVGFGTSPSLITLPLAGNEVITDKTLSPEDGYFIGGSIGVDTGAPYLFNFFHRIELYGLYGETDDSARASSPPTGDIALTAVDGTVLGVNGRTGRTTVERTTWEGALRFEGDDRVDSSTTVTYVIAPFIRGFEEDSRTSVTACCDFGRTSSVDATLYGIYIAAEPETWLTPNFALVARGGVGVYGYDADGSFRSYGDAYTTGDFDAAVSDGDSGAGFRGLLGVGLKFKIAPTALLEGFAEADYFSKVPTAKLITNSIDGGFVSHVGDDDLWELRAGGRLTIGLGN